MNELVDVLTSVVGGHDPSVFTEDTLLFGVLPELDSLALVELIASIEGRFDFEMDEEDITAEVFESVGSLATYIDVQLDSRGR